MTNQKKKKDLVPSNGVYYNNRAAAYIGQKNYKKALSDCTAALELDANNAKVRRVPCVCVTSLHVGFGTCGQVLPLHGRL